MGERPRNAEYWGSAACVSTGCFVSVVVFHCCGFWVRSGEAVLLPLHVSDLRALEWKLHSVFACPYGPAGLETGTPSRECPRAALSTQCQEGTDTQDSSGYLGVPISSTARARSRQHWAKPRPIQSFFHIISHSFRGFLRERRRGSGADFSRFRNVPACASVKTF